MNTCTERRISVIDRILTTFGKLLAVCTSSCCSNLIQYRDALNDFLQKRLVERHVNDSIKFRSLYDVVGFYLHLIFFIWYVFNEVSGNVFSCTVQCVVG